ncbi:hypothetical protein KAFR_0A04710 [Kazachstania africana CBS 2517]|uniref:Genetic interactor of prohibitin 7, mitochondrial n=1 Tax=Kazachstania africana (strain ATCC 22294 / BCRC 22015 / CBS 2517 / CECT 1963 / NBRC 1671 / NRRL Y-8276) TaxID=1071382 RepID=H2ANF6_KAZAF|nr:hypothetical protein KAFR_0A04710 [Kazachstania africana CBS 2517]CCF55906.1 hypothetical protein KAFR_0A04710 [Kazachstania africana CBS 2517]
MVPVRYSSSLFPQNGIFKSLVYKSFSTKGRTPPQSLLLKQKNRVCKRDNDIHGITSTANPLAGALDDIAALFKPNMIDESEEIESRNAYRNMLERMIHSEKLGDTLKSTFILDEKKNVLNTEAVLSNFSKLDPIDRDMVQMAAKELYSKETSWKDLPTFIKQLQYYISYGPHGARNGQPFNELDLMKNSPKAELDSLSKLVLVLFFIICLSACIKRIEMKRANLSKI